MKFWQVHAFISSMLLLALTFIILFVNVYYPQTLYTLIIMNMALNIVAYMYAIFSLKIATEPDRMTKEIGEHVIKQIKKWLVDDNDK